MPFPDLVIVLPGISGSVLAKDGRDIWGTSAGAIWSAVSSRGDTIRTLQLNGPDDPSVDDLGDGITATRLVRDLHLIPGLWKIDGYSRILARLQSDLGLALGRNLFEFPYDWRRDNRVAARRLQHKAHEWLTAWRNQSGNAAAKLILVGHSMGGLVSRYFLEVLDGWKDARALITFGTPFRGSLNAVGYLSNGYATGIGPLQVDFSKTLQSMTSVYQLLPAFQCVDKGTGNLERVGETDGLPNIDAARARDALRFYREMNDAQQSNAKLDAYQVGKYNVFPIVGVAQPTFQSAHVANGKLSLLQMIGSKDLSGDGTVPRVSATPPELGTAHREIFVSELHGSLQNFDPALVNLVAALQGTEIDLLQFNFAGPATVSLLVDDVYAPELVTVRATLSFEAPISASIVDATTGAVVKTLPLQPVGDEYLANTSLPPGPYRITATAQFPDRPVSVTDVFLVVDPMSA
jgi:hypothetical protein